MTFEKIIAELRNEIPNDKELREFVISEFVNSGFITVHQWRNFIDYLGMKLRKTKLDQTLLCEKIAEDEKMKLYAEWRIDVKETEERLSQQNKTDSLTNSEMIDGTEQTGFADALIQEKQKHKDFVEKEIKFLIELNTPDLWNSSFRYVNLKLQDRIAELESEVKG